MMCCGVWVLHSQVSCFASAVHFVTCFGGCDLMSWFHGVPKHTIHKVRFCSSNKMLTYCITYLGFEAYRNQ